jgi:hypothetical protein
VSTAGEPFGITCLIDLEGHHTVKFESVARNRETNTRARRVPPEAAKTRRRRGLAVESGVSAAASLALAVLLTACGSAIDASLDNKSCTDDGECLPGYTCSSERICVKRTGTIDESQREADASQPTDSREDAGRVPTGSAPLVCSRGVACGDTCVDIDPNPEHCGGCGRSCPLAEHGEATCSSGTCGVACDEGYTRCGNRCYELSTDPDHCGSCTFSCPSAIANGIRSCVEGKCQMPCNPGYRECNGSCVQADSDPSHCGGCGIACAADQRCAGGLCVKECPAGTTECERSCVDPKTDVRHCGQCGQACTAPANAIAACREAMCAFDCGPGLTACSGVCVDTRTDLANCGACGQVCPDSGNFSSPVCSAGSCSARCDLGFVACEGQCVSVALLSQSRAFAACAVLAGLQDISRCEGMGENASYCNSQCVDTSTDERHCGNCWTACGGGQTCEAGSCK